MPTAALLDAPFANTRCYKWDSLEVAQGREAPTKPLKGSKTQKQVARNQTTTCGLNVVTRLAKQWA